MTTKPPEVRVCDDENLLSVTVYPDVDREHVAKMVGKEMWHRAREAALEVPDGQDPAVWPEWEEMVSGSHERWYDDGRRVVEMVLEAIPATTVAVRIAPGEEVTETKEAEV